MGTHTSKSGAILIENDFSFDTYLYFILFLPSFIPFISLFSICGIFYVWLFRSAFCNNSNIKIHFFFIHPAFYSKEYQFEVKLKSFCLKIHVHFLPKRKNVTKENESIVDNLMQLFWYILWHGTILQIILYRSINCYAIPVCELPRERPLVLILPD